MDDFERKASGLDFMEHALCHADNFIRNQKFVLFIPGWISAICWIGSSFGAETATPLLEMQQCARIGEMGFVQPIDWYWNFPAGTAIAVMG